CRGYSAAEYQGHNPSNIRILRHTVQPFSGRPLPKRVVASPIPDHSRAHEQETVPADPLSGAISAGRRLRHRRLRALFALSRGRILASRAGLRWWLADRAVQEPL